MRRWRLLVHLLRLISLPHWARHRIRSTLTLVGVSLGVATVVGVADVSKSVLASFEATVQVVAGAADLEITNPSGDVSDDLVERVARVEGVRTVGGVAEGFLPLTDRPDETLYVLGLDFLGESSIWEAQLPRQAVDLPDQLAFVAQPDSMMVTRKFAQRTRATEGSTVAVTAPDGVRVLR